MGLISVTLLIPFDIGRSYILPIDFDWTAELKSLPEKEAAGLSAHQFGDDVRDPLGKPVRMEILQGRALEALDEALKGTTWCSNAKAEVIFFPIGIAVLILRADLSVSASEAWPRFEKWEKGAYKILAPIGAIARDRYVALAKRLELPEIKESARSPKENDYPWIYPLYFTDTATELDQEAHIASIHTANVEVFIRWKNAQIKSPPLFVGDARAARRLVEAIFIVASGAWEMLNVTDALLDHRLHDMAHAQVSDKDATLGRMRSVRLFRAFCARALDGSHAFRWTVDQDTLKLLGTIQLAWDTARWSEAVQRKLELLVLFYEQSEAEQSERQNFIIAAVALVIALVSSVSACGDILNTVDPSFEIIKARAIRAAIMLSLPLFGGITTVYFIRYRRRR